MQLYIGLDLGGSGIKAGLVDEHGRLLARLSRSYDATVAATRVVDEMAVAAEGVCARAGFSLSQAEAVGIGSPGLLDVQRGVVQRSANIAAWQDVPVCRWLSDRLKLPSVLENDANAAAYGEYWVGACRSCTGAGSPTPRSPAAASSPPARS